MKGPKWRRKPARRDYGRSIFVSYPAADDPRAELHAMMKKLEHAADFWVRRYRETDYDDAGRRRVVEKGVEESGYTVGVLSRNTRPYEIGVPHVFMAYALSQRKIHGMPLLIVRLDDVRLPWPFENATSVDLFRDVQRGVDDLFARLTGGTAALVEFPQSVQISAPSVQVVTAVDAKLLAYFQTHPDELRRIDRRRFEELVAELFDGFGYDVELTAKTRDGGRDVIAIARREYLSKLLIECKRPDPGVVIGIRPVRELFGVKTDEGATKAILATTVHFSPDALLFFDRHKWELEPRDFGGLMEWIDEYMKAERR